MNKTLQKIITYSYIAAVLIPAILSFTTVPNVKADPLTITLQPDPSIMIDTMIKSTNPSTNYATNTSLGVGESNAAAEIDVSLLKFDGSYLPTGISITSVTLSVWVKTDLSDNARTMSVMTVLRPWVETATWHSRMGGAQYWQVDGAYGAADIAAEEVGSVALANDLAVNTKVDIVLDPVLVTKNLIKDDYYGFKLQMDTNDNDQYLFYSSDETTNTMYRPQLYIEYELGDTPPEVDWYCRDIASVGSGEACDNVGAGTPVASPINITGDMSTFTTPQSESYSGPFTRREVGVSLGCTPYSLCKNDYPIYYRVELNVSWSSRFGEVATHPKLFSYLDVPGGIDVDFSGIPCGAEATTGSCSLVKYGVIDVGGIGTTSSPSFDIALNTIVVSGVTTDYTITHDLTFSLTPVTGNCQSVYMLLEQTAYTIDPTIETPLGPSGSPADNQIYTTEIGQIYMVRTNDGPWNDGTTSRYDAAVSVDGSTWETLEDFSETALCVDVDPFDPEYMTVYFTATTTTFYIRANDTTGNFANNTNDLTTPFQYRIGMALLFNPGCPAFTYSPEDLHLSITVSSEEEDVPVYDPEIDPIVGEEWYGIKVDSGTWNEDAPTTPRIDMDFSFIQFGPQEDPPGWQDLSMGSPLVSCVSTDGFMVFVQAPAVEGLVLHLRVNDQDDPLDFTDNTGDLEVSVYHVTNTFIPTGCAAEYSTDDLVASGQVQGDQVYGRGFGNSFGSSNTGVSTSYYMKLGGWYMLRTKDGPWTASSDSGEDYVSGEDYFDIEVKRGFEDVWYAPEDWNVASCVVDVDMLGHKRIYFRVPDNADSGGTEFMIRVAGASSTTDGSMGWELYQAVDDITSGGDNPWETCIEDYGTLEQINKSWIPVKSDTGVVITQYNTGGGSISLETGKQYYLITSNGPWQDFENPGDRYDAQLSSDGGVTWFVMSDHPDVTCSVTDQLGQYGRAIIDVEVGQIWKIRVADTESAIFADNEGSLAYTIYDSVFVPTYDPGEDIFSDSDFDACLPFLVRPAFSSTLTAPERVIPDLPTSWDVSDWVSYVGEWFESFSGFTGELLDNVGEVIKSIGRYLGEWIQYVNRSVMSYFAWCPRHVNTLLIEINKLQEKEPLASVLELETASDNTIAEVKSYDWGGGGEGGGVGEGYEDTSIFSFGEGGGEGDDVDTVNNIIEKMFPIDGGGFDVWDGGEIVAFGSIELPDYYYTCNTAFTDFLPSKLRSGVCFATAYWKETGAAWWIQLSLDISTVFILVVMIKSSAQSLIYMMTGVRPWTKDGAIRLLDNTVAGNAFSDGKLERAIDDLVKTQSEYENRRRR